MVGQNIGKYRVADRVGRGGMGTVYRAVDETLHREVAIKVLNAELNDPEVAKRFRAEAITVARLSHPGIATIYELFQHEGQWLMVMEFVRGETLESIVERMGPLSPQRGAEICMQALAALAHAHSMGVVHRDLKPANLMITETGSVKIMDFGIARVAGTEHLTNAGYMMGTPAYMAPEQVLGHEIDARADLYAMGVVFYRLVTKKLPFKGDTPFAMAQSQVNDPPTPVGVERNDLPPWVDQVVVKSLAKVPEQRFQSAVEFHEAFARCLAGLPLSTTYSSSAPTELLMTPSRAMPTGTIRTPTGMSTGYTAPIPSPTAVQPPAAPPPTATSSTPATAPPPSAPGTGTTAVPKSSPVTTTPTAKTAPAPGAGAKKGLSPAAIGAVAVLIAILGAGAWYFVGRRGGEPAQIGAENAVDPSQQAADIPLPNAPGGDATAQPPGTPPQTPTPTTAKPAAPGATVAGASPTTTTPPPPPAAGTEGRGATAVTPPVAPAKAAVDDTPVTFEDLRLITVRGTKGEDTDAVIAFGDGQINVLAKAGRAPLATMSYGRVVKATYVRARDPKWDLATFGPPAKFDTPGTMFRRSAHWLVIQASDAYMILRLEDRNAQRILEALSTRTGIRIDRPAAQ